LASLLREAGLAASDVREEGLRGHPDVEILEYAVSRSFVLVTGDLGFGGMLRSRPAVPGLIITRLPDEWPASAVNDLLVKVLTSLSTTDIAGFLIVIEPDRIRRRWLQNL
jgi:predicted nuclease of predicted toxin-antitoxin system